MARIKYTTPKTIVKKEKVVVTEHYCSECSHHYGDHEIGADGKPFLCHCDAHGDYYKKFSRFLDQRSCDLFNQSCEA